MGTIYIQLRDQINDLKKEEIKLEKETTKEIAPLVSTLTKSKSIHSAKTAAKFLGLHGPPALHVLIDSLRNDLHGEPVLKQIETSILFIIKTNPEQARAATYELTDLSESIDERGWSKDGDYSKSSITINILIEITKIDNKSRDRILKYLKRVKFSIKEERFDLPEPLKFRLLAKIKNGLRLIEGL